MVNSFMSVKKTVYLELGAWKNLWIQRIGSFGVTMRVFMIEYIDFCVSDVTCDSMW